MSPKVARCRRSVVLQFPLICTAFSFHLTKPTPFSCSNLGFWRRTADNDEEEEEEGEEEVDDHSGDEDHDEENAGGDEEQNVEHAGDDNEGGDDHDNGKYDWHAEAASLPLSLSTTCQRRVTKGTHHPVRTHTGLVCSERGRGKEEKRERERESEGGRQGDEKVAEREVEGEGYGGYRDHLAYLAADTR
jgi:hypothetical protein